MFPISLKVEELEVTMGCESQANYLCRFISSFERTYYSTNKIAIKVNPLK